MLIVRPATSKLAARPTLSRLIGPRALSRLTDLRVVIRQAGRHVTLGCRLLRLEAKKAQSKISAATARDAHARDVRRKAECVRDVASYRLHGEGEKDACYRCSAASISAKVRATSNV